MSGTEVFFIIFLLINYIKKVLNESDDEQLVYPIRENGKYKNPWDARKKNTSFLNFILFSEDKSNVPSDANVFLKFT